VERGGVISKVAYHQGLPPCSCCFAALHITWLCDYSALNLLNLCKEGVQITCLVKPVNDGGTWRSNTNEQGRQRGARVGNRSLRPSRLHM